MININIKNQGFSSIYRTRVGNKIKIYKIYNDIAFSSFQRTNNQNNLNFYQKINKLKISANHKVLSKHILEMNEISKDYYLTKRLFFKNITIQNQLKNKLQILKSLNLELVDNTLIEEINNYLPFIKSLISSRKKLYKLKDYIDVYPQNRICHGDLHLSNLLISQKKLFLLDWDYRVKSCLGFDLAMFSYLENFNKVQINQISKVFNLSVKEINHYIPICMILDFAYQKILKKNKKKSKLDNNLKENIINFIEDTL